MAKKKQTRAEKLAEAYEGQYGDLTVSELKDKIIELLMQVDDLREQKKAHSDSFKDLISDKLDALDYCRERIPFVQRLDLENEATRILESN